MVAPLTPFAFSSASQFEQRPETVLGPRAQQGSALLQADMNQIIQVSGTLDPAHRNFKRPL